MQKKLFFCTKIIVFLRGKGGWLPVCATFASTQATSCLVWSNVTSEEERFSKI